MQKERVKKERRIKRKLRIAASIRGSKDRPRLVLFRSNRYLSAQLVDDAAGKTIFSQSRQGKTIADAKALGADIAAKLKEKKIALIVFDRGGYRYHGSVEAFADAVREGGVKF